MTVYKGQTSIKMIKHDFLKIWQKLTIWERIKMKISNAKFFTENTFFFTSFKGLDNRFSLSCLICARELTQNTTYGKVHWVVLKLF